MKLGVLLMLATSAISVFAEPMNDDLIIKRNGEVIEGNIADYINYLGNDVEIAFPELMAIDPNYENSFRWDKWASTFMNVTSSCKVLVVKVTSGKGYNQLYHHKSQPFDTFKHPPYRDSSTWVQKAPVVAMDCSDQLPGIAW